MWRLYPIFAAVQFLALLSVISGKKDCGQNEVWTECTGCELKCGESGNKPCALSCRPPSCFCSPDQFRRTSNKSCMPLDQCPTKKLEVCGKNEIFKACRGCEGNCDEQFVRCTRQCKPRGCECPAKKGYVRDDHGHCIKFENCGDHE